MYIVYTIRNCFIVFTLMILASCSNQPNKATQSVSETIPLTMANIRGHEEMYSQGWFIVSSSEKALQYAKKHGAKSALSAIKRAKFSIANRSNKIGDTLKQDVEQGFESGRQVFQKGSKNTQEIMQQTENIVELEKNVSRYFANSAYSRFVTGYLTLKQRTRDDLTALQSIPGGYFSTLKSDFKNLSQLSKKTREKLTPEITSNWANAFERGVNEFNEEYEKSGTTGNSLSGLGNILKGYWKGFYYGLITPGVDNLKFAGAKSGVEIGNIIALPTSALFIVSGRTVESLGMTIWYSSNIGYSLVSPTIEGGLLGGMSILSAATVPVTAASGTAAGIINQIAVTAAAPLTTTATASAKVSVDAAKYSALVVYDISTATMRVSIEQLSSGVVLGYNALTALPAQAVLGATSGVFFLAWDGPRLVIAYANGTIESDNKLLDISQLPVGSVIDLNKLKQEKGITVEVISDDKNVIKDVLNNSARDMLQE